MIKWKKIQTCECGIATNCPQHRMSTAKLDVKIHALTVMSRTICVILCAKSASLSSPILQAIRKMNVRDSCSSVNSDNYDTFE